MTKVSLIVARDKFGAIGLGGKLPWRPRDVPSDMRWFQQHTLGKPVIMGRKTFESIFRPLPNRKMFVLTRDPDAMRTIPFVEAHHTLSALIAFARQSDEVVIIGGKQVYDLAKPVVSRVYLTTIEAEFTADTFWTEDYFRAWPQIERGRNCRYWVGQSGDQYDMRFEIYDRGGR